MKTIILFLTTILVPTLLLADSVPTKDNSENSGLTDTQVAAYLQQQNHSPTATEVEKAYQQQQNPNLPKDFFSQTRAVIDQVYNNKAITTYEYLDLIIKLEQLRKQNSPNVGFDWIVNK